MWAIARLPYRLRRPRSRRLDRHGAQGWIGVYDARFLGWVLFANLPMFRLEDTVHMDAAYHQKWFHVKGMLFPGIIFTLSPPRWWGGW